MVLSRQVSVKGLEESKNFDAPDTRKSAAPLFFAGTWRYLP